MEYPWLEGPSLQSQIRFVIEEYEDDLEDQLLQDYDPDIETTMKMIALGRWAIGATRELSTSDPEILHATKVLIENPLIKAIVHEQLQLAAASEFSTQTEAMADRCMELINVIVEHEPSEAVLRFMRRVSRCYIAGFFPETVIMCRAVMENAVRYKRARFFCEENLLRSPQGQNAPSMSDLLDQAASLGWLSSRAKKDARTVWTRGNKAIHHDPGTTSAVLDTIERTVHVVRSLEV